MTEETASEATEATDIVDGFGVTVFSHIEPEDLTLRMAMRIPQVPPNESVQYRSIASPLIPDEKEAIVNTVLGVFVKRFTRLTLAFSKKLANLEAAVAMHIAAYNFTWRSREKNGPNSGRKRPTPAMQASNCRASSAVRTGVVPTVTTCLGPRTDAAGFVGRICPVTSQSNSIFNAASFCFTLGRSIFVPSSSTYAATRNGLICCSPILRSSHQWQKSRTARP